MEKTIKPIAAPKAIKKPTANDLALEVQATDKVWAPKNREYRIKGAGKNTPRTYLQAEDRPGRGNKRLLHFDEATQTRKSIRYVVNSPEGTPFVTEQDESGWALAQEHIMFEHGVLGVDANNISLQKFLDVHPWNEKNGGGTITFFEYDPEAEAKVAVDALMLEVDAVTAAVKADLATTEAVLRPKLGSLIHEMKTDRLTREIVLYAKRDPKEFLEAIGDENLMLQNVVYTAIDYRILKLADSGLTLKWAANDQKILAIPFGNDPYKYIAEWFKSDDGLEIMNKITQKLKKQ